MTEPDPLTLQLAADRKRLEREAGRSPAEAISRRIRRRGRSRLAGIAASILAGSLCAWWGLAGLADVGLFARVPDAALIVAALFIGGVVAAAAWTLD